MMTRLLWVKRKSVVAVVICAVLAAASIAYWQINQSAQATMVYPHPGLVGWWRFDEGSGTAAGDSSGYGNNGTINGATWVDGKYGKALNFDGVTNHVSLGNPVSLDVTASSFTMSAWIKPESVSVAWKYFLARQGYHTGLFINQGKICFDMWNASNAHLSVEYSGAMAGQWYYVVGTYDGNAASLYVNGAFIGSVVVGNPKTGLTNWFVGTVAPGNGYEFQGIIDEACIYNRTLSMNEIQENLQKGPDFSSKILAKVPNGTTQVITTVSWQGTGSINITIVSPSQNYTENMVPTYQKTTYSTSTGTSSMLNIKRLSVSINALSSDQNWYVVLTYDNVEAYQIAVEAQK